MLLLFIFVSTYTVYSLNPYDLGHIQAAEQYIREHEKVTGVIPGPSEFRQWTRQMDSVKNYRFEGYGYRLLEGCGFTSSDYCIEFWTGEVWVTYRSWFPSVEWQLVNSPPILEMIVFLAISVATGLLGRQLISRTKDGQ